MIKYKPYRDLQSLLMLTHCWKKLLIDFAIRLSISTNWKGNSYDLILVIIDWLTKMVYYELVKITIGTLDLIKVILNTVI